MVDRTLDGLTVVSTLTASREVVEIWAEIHLRQSRRVDLEALVAFSVPGLSEERVRMLPPGLEEAKALLPRVFEAVAVWRWASA